MKYIVVIDDSITIRTSIEYTLKNLEWPVLQAENGADALSKINEIKVNGDTIAMCITDVNMPIMDGITFVKELRKSDKFCPILMLTTESDNSKIQEGKEAGASGWLIKPFKSEQLVNVVKKLAK
jgi:two-component system, chemotaxis family, chemotaxis protein CheY